MATSSTFAPPIFMWALFISMALLTAGLALAFLRLWLGPSIPDRIISLDIMSTLFVGVLVIVSIATNESRYLDVAIAAALIVFLTTVAFARCLEKRSTSSSESF